MRHEVPRTPRRGQAEARTGNARCAIIYHYIARYRMPIFEELSRSTSTDFVFLSDDKTPEAALELAPLHAHPDVNWIRVRNRWLFSKVLWQSGVVKAAFFGNFKCFIFLGERRFASTWVAALVARLRGKPVLFWTHGVTKRERGLSKRIRHAFYSIPDGLLLYGSWARQQLVSWGMQAERLHIVYNSLDYERQKEMFEQLIRKEPEGDKLSTPPYRLAAIGRLIPSKRFDLLVEAAAILNRRGVSVTVNIIGGGPELSNLLRQARILGVQQLVHFLGASSCEQEVGPVLFDADICVLPGKVGLGVIHALSYGTPVIVHDDFDHHTPEIDAFRDGATGAIFRRGSAPDLARAIEGWLAGNCSREKIRQKCRVPIDLYFNPMYQRRVIEGTVRALLGEKPVAG